MSPTPSHPTLPPAKPETVTFSIHVPKELAAELSRIAEEQGHVRNTVVTHFLTWAVEAWKERPKGARK